jgi:hypothetical protein
MITLLVLSLFAGCIVAGCGAWKDTLFEPFSWVKFFRSPLLIFILAAILARIALPSIIILVLSACALERLLTEGWKAIVRKPPGKFKGGKDQSKGWLRTRLSA